jgi:hypothetical protein
MATSLLMNESLISKLAISLLMNDALNFKMATNLLTGDTLNFKMQWYIRKILKYGKSNLQKLGENK